MLKMATAAGRVHSLRDGGSYAHDLTATLAEANRSHIGTTGQAVRTTGLGGTRVRVGGDLLVKELHTLSIEELKRYKWKDRTVCPRTFVVVHSGEHYLLGHETMHRVSCTRVCSVAFVEPPVSHNPCVGFRFGKKFEQSIELAV